MYMRKYLLAAVAAAAFATPAAARDGSGYVGLDAGFLFPRDTHLDATVDYGVDGVTDYNNAAQVHYKTGYDVDLIGGYDLGMFRLEAELGYKRAKVNEVRLGEALLADLTVQSGSPVGLTNDNFDFESSSSARILSGMVNGMFDFGNEDGWSGFLGAGAGIASVKMFGDTDSTWAWQAIAGVRVALSPNIDVGLKYRYFNTGKVHFNDDIDVNGLLFPASF